MLFDCGGGALTEQQQVCEAEEEAGGRLMDGADDAAAARRDALQAPHNDGRSARRQSRRGLVKVADAGKAGHLDRHGQTLQFALRQRGHAAVRDLLQLQQPQRVFHHSVDAACTTLLSCRAQGRGEGDCLADGRGRHVFICLFGKGARARHCR